MKLGSDSSVHVSKQNSLFTYKVHLDVLFVLFKPDLTIF